jgi:hypothetical protein
MTDHPITPPPELVRQWWVDAQVNLSPDAVCWVNHVAVAAAQWGADQELDACCEALDNLNDGYWSSQLRAARRPKPLSLKEQALEALDHIEFGYSTGEFGDTIRRALEQLPNHE